MANKKRVSKPQRKAIIETITTCQSLEVSMRTILKIAKQRLLRHGRLPTMLCVLSGDGEVGGALIPFRSYEEKRARRQSIGTLLAKVRASQAVVLSESWHKAIPPNSEIPWSLENDPDRVECISIEGGSATEKLLFQQLFYRSEKDNRQSKNIVFGELLISQVLNSEWFSGVVWNPDTVSSGWSQDSVNVLFHLFFGSLQAEH